MELQKANYLQTLQYYLITKMKLEPRIKEKLLSNNAATCRIAIKMNCSQQNIIKLIKNDSAKLCQLNYAVVIKETLKLNPNSKIYVETKRAAIKQPSK